MKRFLFLACMLLCASVVHAGCDELREAINNLDKAVSAKSAVIASDVNDLSFEAKLKRDRARQEIESLLKLRTDLFQQECRENQKPKPQHRPPAQPQQPQAKGKRFKPAGKMY